MQRPEAVVFDLGKVLLDFDYEKLARRIVEHCAISVEELLALLNQSKLLHRFETGLLTSSEFFEEVKRASQFFREYEVFEPIFADIFTPIPEMIQLHGRLVTAGLPTFIFSNTNEIAVQHIRREYPFFNSFTDYILSYEHRSMKPEPRIYEVVENKSGRKGGALLYIDDREENVAGGRARGWQAIQHKDARETVSMVEKLLA